MLPIPMFLLLLPTPAPDAPAPDAPAPAPDAPTPAPDAPAPAPDATALTTIPRFDAAVHALVARTLHTLLLESVMPSTISQGRRSFLECLLVLVGLHEGFLPDSTAPTSEPMPTHNARKQHQRSCQMDLTGCLRNVRANCDLGLNLRSPRIVSSGSSGRCRRTNSTGAGIVCKT
jgi:3-oxoacyl-ACP reductase-like protein